MNEKNWHNLSLEQTANILKTDIKEGLSEKEVKERQKIFGLNKLPEEKAFSKFRIFSEQFRSPLIYILAIAGFITLILRDFSDAIVIFGAVFLNTVIGFFQENKTSKILSELKKAIKVKAYVIRDGNEKEIEQAELVPGDIFLLKRGNKAPTDGRLIEARSLKINEASLTGEWLPVEKNPEILPVGTPLADRDNMVYTGCIIEDGRGKAVATETGIQTEIGKVAQLVKETKEEKTPYQKKIIYLSKIIGLLIVFVSFLIFILGIMAGQDFFQMFLVVVAVAVAAIPEGLPSAITVILALGMQRILKKKGLVRKMVAAETLGSASIICSDKTGTLTEAKMKVDKIYPSESSILALKIAVLCAEAFIENPGHPLEKWIVRGRPTEKALLLAGIQAGLNKEDLEKSEPKIDEISFDPVYKYSAVLRKLTETENIIYFLGAPEIVLGKSKYYDSGGSREILTEEKIKELSAKCEESAAKGQRILAVAYRKIESRVLKGAGPEIKNLQDFCESLVFGGLIALHDPLRPDVKEAVKICRQAGMKPIIVTGDHKLTAKAIAAELGLLSKEENIIEGRELEKLSDEEFQKRLDKIEIYARVEPAQKLKIIEAWQKRGEVVAMTGDGINDAPALKKADIGLALGSGTDVAKEAADLILLTDSFSVIVAAVQEGRRILDNIRKVVTYLLSDSFTELILISASVLARSPFLPLLPAQILWVNLIEDSLPSLALAFEPKEKNVMKRKPENPKTSFLTKEMKALIFIIGIFTDLLLLSLFFWLLKRDLPQAEIQTIIFAGLAIDSLFYVFSCRNLKENVWKINPFSNLILTFSWFWGILMLLLAVYLPFFQNLLKTAPLNLFDWGLVLGLGFINLILIETTKWYFISSKKKS